MLFDQLTRASLTQADPRDPVVAQWFGGRTSLSGVAVTHDVALALPTLYACVKLLAETIASLPLSMYKSTATGKEVDPRHPLHTVLHDQPNPWQTSYEWREMMVGHAALRGNAYSEIVSGHAKPVAELIPLHPDKVNPFIAPDNTLAYKYSPGDGPSRVILWDEMHHIRGLSSDGYVGIDPITLLRDSIGLTKATEDHGAAFFGNGSSPGGVLTHPGKLGDGVDRLREAWEARHKGPQGSSKVAVLEEGMEWQSIGIEPEKAQFLETRKHQGLEICRLFNIPPHLVQILDNATFSNIEHQGLQFVTHTLRPWLVRWEQAIRRDLQTEAGKKSHFPRFKVEGLLRGDIKSRYEAYKTGRGWGWLSVNDVRDIEDMNRIDGGDQYLVPLNMTTPDKIGQEPAMQASAERVARKEHRALTRASKHVDTFPDWLAEFCADHAEWASKALGSDAAEVAESLRAGWQDMPADENEYVEKRAGQIMRMVNGY